MADKQVGLTMAKVAHPSDARVLKIFQLLQGGGASLPDPQPKALPLDPTRGTVNDCMSVVSSWSNNERYALLMFRIHIRGSIHYTFCDVYAFS